MRALISAAASNDVQQGAKADALRFEPVRRRAHPSDLRHGKLVPLGGRLDLDEGDADWIGELWRKGTSSLKRRYLGRLRRCSVQLGELEPYM